MTLEKARDDVRVNLHLTLAANRLGAFAELLQQGFRVKARVGNSIRDVLCEQLGVTAEYLDQRVNTIFLDGKPVDDTKLAVVRENSTLALSASMPGFVGAAFRKAGFYAAMRRQITHEKEEASGFGQPGFFVLKLYNFVAEELGPLFLAMGLFLNEEQVQRFMVSRSEEFWSAVKAAEVDGRQVPVESLREMSWHGADGLVQLSASTEDRGA